MSGRFTQPDPGGLAAVAFPPVDRVAFGNGLRVWSVTQSAVPVVSMALVLDGGTATDPAGRPGLVSLVSSLAAEAAGSRDALGMADALARIGSHMEVQAGADATTLALTTLTRHFGTALELLADVARRPRFDAGDFARLRDLRLSRLRQSSRVASTVADRALVAAVFGDHPYGHGSLGTTRAIEAATVDDLRGLWNAATLPARTILLVAGDVEASAVQREARRVFGDWHGEAGAPTVTPVAVGRSFTDVIAVHRPGAAQAELRVGHPGPPRRTPDYHALVTLNALLGGQFTSRINRNLRESRAITYGARTAFDMRRAGGLFSCDTAVQADSAAVAATEVLRELRDVTADGAIGADELEQARASLTRGYVRHFETAPHFLRALAELATYDLPADTFDRFVPAVSRLSIDDVARAARAALQPDNCAVVVVTDLDEHGKALEGMGRVVRRVEVEF
jgi:zinc protease